MDHGISIGEYGEREFVPFTDSLASRIRWRACDYAALISAELDLILAADPRCRPACPPRATAAAPSLASEIRLFDPRKPRSDVGGGVRRVS